MKSMNMPPRRLRWTTAMGFGLVVLGLVSSLVGSPRLAAAQPRPTLTASPAVSPPAPTSLPVSAPTPEPLVCESICGRVINVGSNVGEPGQMVQFSGVGWSVEMSTSANGEYGFGRLGTEVGLLNLIVEEGSDLRPLTTDIPFAPVPGWTTVVNLGAYREPGDGVAPLVPAVRVDPTWVRPGERVDFTVRVENRLQTKISGVWVTDLLPEGLSLINVTTDRGDAMHEGSYGAAFIGDLGPGDAATVKLIAEAAQEGPTGTLHNRISLIYREHAAAQVAASVTVGRPPPTAARAVAQATETAAGSVPAHTPAVLPSTGPGLLPVTGFGLTAIGVGLALGATALAARGFRKRQAEDTAQEEE